MLAVLATPTASRADFEAGRAAYKAGDFQAAMKEWLPLAEAGDAEAQFRIGVLYDAGEGMPVDGELARRWYEKAEKQNHLSARFNLALLYDLGEKVVRDYAAAFRLYEINAMAMHKKSQVNLGLMYVGGHGVNRDYVKAYQWFFIVGKMGEEAVEYFRQIAPEKDIEEGRRAAVAWLERHGK
jgi:TPR repeat protein